MQIPARVIMLPKLFLELPFEQILFLPWAELMQTTELAWVVQNPRLRFGKTDYTN